MWCRADQTFLLPAQADAEPHYLAALRSHRDGGGSDRRDKAFSMVMKEGEMPVRSIYSSCLLAQLNILAILVSSFTFGLLPARTITIS